MIIKTAQCGNFGHLYIDTSYDELLPDYQIK